jgi:Icc-related predicted phosphoesterase
MKIVAISDTHGQHNDLELPKGDMIIHAGDVSKLGHKSEVLDFLYYFSELDFEHKIFIAGNHDFFFEKESKEEIAKVIPQNVIYLNDSGIQIEGINIWGSPIQPWFFDWAFNKQRGTDIAKHWELIPKDTDILVTHGPPMGILDKTTKGLSVGCEELTRTVKSLHLKMHIFGHIHEAYGCQEVDGTEFINASVLDVKYRLVNKAFLREL